jgi:hypothetical protein
MVHSVEPLALTLKLIGDGEDNLNR